MISKNYKGVDILVCKEYTLLTSELQVKKINFITDIDILNEFLSKEINKLNIVNISDKKIFTLNMLLSIDKNIKQFLYYTDVTLPALSILPKYTIIYPDKEIKLPTMLNIKNFQNNSKSDTFATQYFILHETHVLISPYKFKKILFPYVVLQKKNFFYDKNVNINIPDNITLDLTTSIVKNSSSKIYQTLNINKQFLYAILDNPTIKNDFYKYITNMMHKNVNLTTNNTYILEDLFFALFKEKSSYDSNVLIDIANKYCSEVIPIIKYVINDNNDGFVYKINYKLKPLSIYTIVIECINSMNIQTEYMQKNKNECVYKESRFNL